MLKRCVIFGAGQSGRMLKNLLSTEHQVLAFTDNNQEFWGSRIGDIDIISPSDAIALNPECIWIATLNRDAAESITEQLQINRFLGTIIPTTNIRKKFDIRIAVLRLISGEIQARGIQGAVAELGVYRGDFAAEINRLFPERFIYLFDTFVGFSSVDMEIEKSKGYAGVSRQDFSATGIEQVLGKLPFPNMAKVIEGRFPDTAPVDSALEFSLVSLDADLFQPTYEGLHWFYPRLNVGGIILIHDYNSLQYPGVKDAVSRYCSENALFPIPLPDFHGTAILLKQ